MHAPIPYNTHASDKINKNLVSLAKYCGKYKFLL